MALIDKEEKVRYRAAVGLSEMGRTVEAVYDLIVRGLNDEHPGVVYYCMEALGTFGKRAKAAFPAMEMARKKLAQNESVRHAAERAKKAILEDEGGEQ
jgi:HEAT repeat protein